MKYHVHAYAVITIKSTAIEAESQKQAIEKFEQVLSKNLDLNVMGYIPPNPTPGVQHVDFADEIVNFLVDEVGDEEFERTTWYKPDGKTIDNKFHGRKR